MRPCMAKRKEKGDSVADPAVVFRVVGIDKKIAQFSVGGYSSELGRRLGGRMKRLVQGLREYIVTRKLAGQVLNIRTGVLARSVDWKVDIDPGRVWGKVFVGKQAWYGKIHEYGGEFSVPSHGSNRTMAWGRRTRPYYVQVRAHQIKFKERSFMRSSLNEWRDKAVGQIRLAVRETLGISS